MSLIDDLAAVRRLQGKPDLPSPHVIQGFEPGSAPVPPYVPIEREVDSPAGVVTDEFLDAGPPEPPGSPLIPRRPPTLIPPEARGGMLAPPVALPDLIVLGTLASWKGREITLTSEDEKAVRAVVLLAIQRDIDADLRAAGAKKPRKPRAKAEPVSADPPRRGRPRKVAQ